MWESVSRATMVGMAARVHLIGIAGPSGAGKSFLAKHLKAALHGDVLAIDRYYRDLSHLPLEERAQANFDAPDALEHVLLVEQLARLRKGETVPLPVYDFGAHARSRKTETLQPAKVLIVEGLFTLYWPSLRELLDTKVFVDLNEEACLARRRARDVRERGRTPESVLQQYQATVAPMAKLFVRPTLVHADVVVLGDERVEDGMKRVLEHFRGSMG